MSYLFKSLKQPVLLGILFACSFIFNACNTSKNGTKLKIIKNWLTWQVQFKPGTSDDEIALAKAEIDKHIADDIKEADPGHTKILVVTSTYQIDYSDTKLGTQLIINIQLGLGLGIASQQGVRGPGTPPSPGPAKPYQIKDLAH